MNASVSVGVVILAIMTAWQAPFTSPRSWSQWPLWPAPDRTPTTVFGQPGLVSGGADLWRWWWDYACALARSAADDPGAPVPTVPVYGPVLAADEVALLATHAHCSRFYGGQGSYNQVGLLAFGRPAMVIGSVAATAVINARRKAKARADATPRWRDHRSCPVIATNHRLLCHTGEQGWVSFYYDAVADFHPDLSGWAVTLGFDGQCAPLQISGPPVPALAVWAAIGIHGYRWHNDPRLHQLLV